MPRVLLGISKVGKEISHLYQSFSFLRNPDQHSGHYRGIIRALSGHYPGIIRALSASVSGRGHAWQTTVSGRGRAWQALDLRCLSSCFAPP
jgi:hypothetical protein